MNGKRRCCGEKGAGLAATSSSQRGDRLYKSTCTGGSGTRQNFEQFKAKNKGNTRPIVVFQFSNKKFEKICANPCGAKFKEDCAALLLVLVLVQVSHSAGAELTTFEQNTELDVTEPTTTVAPVVNGTSSAQRIGRRWWAATRSRRKSRSSVSTPPSGHNVCHPHNFYYHFTLKSQQPSQSQYHTRAEK